MRFEPNILNSLASLHPALRGSLRSIDTHRQYPADPRETGCTFRGAGVAGCYSLCLSGKFKTNSF